MKLFTDPPNKTFHCFPSMLASGIRDFSCGFWGAGTVGGSYAEGNS